MFVLEHARPLVVFSVFSRTLLPRVPPSHLHYVVHGLPSQLLNMILQVQLGMKLERRCGWFRMALMYTISGLGGKFGWLIRRCDIFFSFSSSEGPPYFREPSELHLLAAVRASGGLRLNLRPLGHSTRGTPACA